MRTKVTLVLIFLNVALFFFIFKFERHWRTEAASLEARRRVLGPEADDIRSIEVTFPGGSYSLNRVRDTWLITRPLDWPANPHAVSGIINALRLLEHENSFSTKDLGRNNNPTLADYGLDKPRLTVAFTSGESPAGGPAAPTILRFGDTTKVGNRTYILSPHADRVHVVERSRVESLFLPLDQLRADTLLTIPVFEARSLSVQTANTSQAGGGVRVRVRREGTRWIFDTPITARASKTAVEIAINQLNALHPKTFNPPPPANLPSAAPTLRVALEGNGRLETLFIGEPVTAPGAPPPRPAPAADVEYYAQLENRSALFTVVLPATLVDHLRQAVERLREPHFLDFDPNAVTSITLAGPSQLGAAPVTLQRLETAADAIEGGAWLIVRRGEGNQGLQSTAADRPAVQQLLARLTQLAATDFVSDNPSGAEKENWGFNRPEREITITLANRNAVPPVAGSTLPPAAANATLVLQLGTDASRKVYARVGAGNATEPGPSIYAVTVDLAREFPIDPLAWRDRTVAVIPPNARFTALKLTELPARRVVFETTFDAAGAPARSPEAVQPLVKQLVPLLRVKRFRPGPLAADDGAWRYQLDVAISLPGGAGGDQVDTKSLFFGERLGGTEQVAGAREQNAVFELEQPFIDALWPLTGGQPDPGPAPPPAVETPDPKPPSPK